MNEMDKPQSSKQTWLWAVLGIFVFVSLGIGVVTLALVKKSGGAVLSLGGGGITPIDLTEFYDQSGSWNTGSEWAQAPRGPTVLGGVPFEMNGLLRLSGRSARNDGKPYRDEVRDIPVSNKFARLHVLHIVSYSTSREEPYARITLRHADGSTTAFPLIYGQHGRDWHRPKYEYPSTLGDPNTKVVWRGEYDETATRGRTLRIFKTTFTNPKPDMEVTAIDLSSENASPNATIIAMSIGPAHLPKVADDPPSLPEPEAPFEGEVKFTAVDAQSGKPVPNLRLKVSGSEAGGSFRTPDVLTDAKGECVVKHPGDSTRTVTVLAGGDGIAMKTIRWQQRNDEVIPTEYTHRVEKGVTIGGVVQDESGQPIPGVTVTLSALGTPGSNDQLPFSQFSLTNDDKGRWEFRSLPENSGAFQIVTAHPEYVEGRYLGDGTAPGYGGERIKLETFLKANAVFKLRKGLVVTGRVLNEKGEPVSGARLLLGDSRYASNPGRAKTDERGEFRIPGANAGSTYLTVQANGFAPESRSITVNSRTPPIEFKLAPGHSFKAKVVDEAGRPVRSARVNVDMWQNRQTIELTGSTDSRGLVTLNSAPASEMSGSVYKSGYMQLHSQPFVADGEEHTFVLRRSVTITGTVIDADTKQPVERFDVTRGQSSGGGQIYWQTYNTTKGVDGSFSVRRDQQFITALQIESDEHLPVVINLESNAGTHYEIELKKGSGPKGIVHTPDGKPAVGAQVGVLVQGKSLWVSMGRIEMYGEGPKAVTAAATGAFTLRSYENVDKIVATHQQGYIEMPFTNFVSGGIIKLQPWGAIEGTLRVGQNPGTNETLTLSSDGGVQFNTPQTKTDDQGRFSMPNVPPGERRIVRLIQISPNSWGHSHASLVTVKTGGVTTVTLGGNGRTVIGKLALSDPSRTINWPQSGHHSLSFYPKPPPLLGLAGAAGYRVWENLPETIAARRESRSYTLQAREDGSFRIDDVLAGTYDLRIFLTEWSENGPRYNNPIGTLNTNIVVPEIASPVTAPPLDLGTLVIPVSESVRRNALR